MGPRERGVDGGSRNPESSQRENEMVGFEKGCFKGGNGLMAEWLGKGLQNLIQRFESASDLKEGF